MTGVQTCARPISAAFALRHSSTSFSAEESARVAILTGSSGHFCAGFDLGAVGTAGYDPDGPGPMGPTRMLLEKPVIAAVEGHAVAGGLELALWCDLRVTAESAVFGVYCRRWGVPLIDGGTVRSEEHTSELQSLMRTTDAVFCLQQKNRDILHQHPSRNHL